MCRKRSHIEDFSYMHTIGQHIGAWGGGSNKMSCWIGVFPIHWLICGGPPQYQNWLPQIDFQRLWFCWINMSTAFKKKIWRRCFYITVFQKESDFLQKMFDVIFILSCMQCLIKQHLWAKRCFVYSVNGQTSISRTIYRGVIAATNGV